MSKLHAKMAFLASGWARNVKLTHARGLITAIESDVEPQAGDECHAILLPGMNNVHSHAFQRGMAGLAERRGPGEDSFWSWREMMYRFALSMDPDDAQAIAAQLYVEMLEAGFCHVGEFHYLHHDCDGRPYGDIGEMAARIGAAAEESGIGLTLLPVFYAHSGFGGLAPNEGQRRFINDRDLYQRLLGRCGEIIGKLDGAILGIAPHSLRAVTPDELDWLAGLRPASPIHIHIAEQLREVEDCVLWSGQRPVEYLLDHQEIDQRWCLIHATHMTDDETARLARSGAVAGLCPITEANLGDGVFNGVDFAASGGSIAIGSDSNVEIGVGAELRAMEYAQRLAHRRRNMLAAPSQSNGENLFARALQGGAQALGLGAHAGTGLWIGASANLVSLNGEDVALAGRSNEAVLDSWIFSGRPLVDCVWVRGRKLVEQGRHYRREPIAATYIQHLEALLS